MEYFWKKRADVVGEKVRKFSAQLFNADYSYLTRSAGILFWIGAPAEIFFYFFETGQGYWDSLPFRITLFLALASLMLVDWKSAKGLAPILYWESVLMAVFPIQTTYQFLHNDGIPYYLTSTCIMFFILGMVTKPWMVPIHVLVGGGGAAMVFISLHGWDPKLQPAILEFFVNAFFCGIAASGVMMVMEGYHRRITEAKVALLKAKEQAVAFEELKKREELIRVFVRPSLVEEIHRGLDPSKFEPVLRNLAILFCDIRDFTQLTEVLSPYEKQTFLNKYFTMMTHPIVKNGGEVDKIMGDCVMGIFPDGDSAVKAAVDMRLQLQELNQKMFSLNQLKIRNGIGIAKGEVMLGNFGSFEKLDRTVIGEAVNIAARLESKTKMYNLEVVVTEDVIRDLKPGSGHYRWIDVAQVKGSTRHLKLYEIYGHQPEEVRQYKDNTRDLLEKALTIYFNKGFKDARRMFRAMLEQVPPHRHVPNDRMDTILCYYLAHCDAWINDPNGSWNMIEKWDGVHVFNEK
ncbi:MAG: adenylate/guanylate cyclase domain-containing protein [Fibrobacteria bacterium]